MIISAVSQANKTQNDVIILMIMIIAQHKYVRIEAHGISTVYQVQNYRLRLIHDS